MGASQHGEARGAAAGSPAAARSSRGYKGQASSTTPCWAQSRSCCLAVQALADCSQISYVVTVFLLGCWLCTLKKISLFASLWNISSRELTL